jgi:hypothetical protein
MTLPGHAQDTLSNPIPLKNFLDSLFKDTVSHPVPSILANPRTIMSPDSIDATVEYGSVDSNYLDNVTHKVHLFGDAYVRYKDLSLKADYIVIDLDSTIATAEGRLDSAGQLAGKPEFKMGDESFTAEKMRYNFQQRKGIIYNALTKEGDLLIHGERTKFVAGGVGEKKDDILYGKGALITTCDAEHPHFGIRASKVKTIPDKLAVIGLSDFQLFGVPTPIVLPFGFYPVSETRTAGLILPRDYERSPQLGFGIRDIGYYFPVKDLADVKLLADIYFNGTWGVGVNANYAQKYKYRGNFAVRYSYRITEQANDYRNNVEKSFSIRMTHNQDPKSNPYQTLGGSINIQSNDFESLNYNDAQSALTNTYSSNFNYSRIFPGKPYSLTAAFNHSQNTRSHQVTINAPELNFRLNRIYPFKNERKSGPEQWYEKIAIQYSGSGRAQLLATDTTLFDPITWQTAQYGVQHKANASLNFNVLKYFNVTPSVDYGETWFFKTRESVFRFDPNDTTFVKDEIVFFPDGTDSIIVKDTVSYGIVDRNLHYGFDPFRTVSAAINVNTQVFGTLQFNKGWLRGVRHVMKPSIGFSYAPASPLSYYDSAQVNVLYPDSMQRYSRFDNLLYSVRPTDIEQANLNYSFNNLFEAKYFSAKDSTDKKLKLFDNISVGGSFNMAAKVNKFSPVNISGTTRLFKGITTVSVGATYSFYALREDQRLSDTFYLDSDNKLLRFDNLRLRFSTRVTFEDIMKWVTGDPKASAEPRQSGSSDESNRVTPTGDRFEDLLGRFSISHEFGVVQMGMTGPDETRITTNSINMIGSMQVTPNWTIFFGNIGYDFISKQLTYPDIGISRDLHCWQMSFNWQPTRGTYAFNISVKPGTFDFLKVPYKRGNYDSSGGF